jgi:hypothetical protein
MQLETKFLRLRTPVTLGSRFGDWHVTWLGLEAATSSGAKPAPMMVDIRTFDRVLASLPTIRLWTETG